MTGCGFTPLYATAGLSPALSSVDVVAPQSREGYLVRQQLNDELARDEETPARYRLTVTNTELRYPRGVYVNNVASRYELQLTVAYSLSDSVTGKIVLQGYAPVEVSYDAATPPYSSVAASQDGEVRAANQAAIRIRLDLARYFDHLANPVTPTLPGDAAPRPATLKAQVAAPPPPPQLTPEGSPGLNTDPSVSGPQSTQGQSTGGPVITGPARTGAELNAPRDAASQTTGAQNAGTSTPPNP